MDTPQSPGKENESGTIKAQLLVGFEPTTSNFQINAQTASTSFGGLTDKRFFSQHFIVN